MAKRFSHSRYDIFIAHSGNDVGIATKLYRLLVNSYRVFLASECLLAGDNWDKEIPRALRESLITIILISSATDSSFYQREEISSAIAMAREDQGGVG